MKGRRGRCGCGCALGPATSKGFSAVDFAEDVLGLTLFPWQRWLLIHALELDASRRCRFRTVVVLVARQNGKTTVVQVLSLWRLLVDGARLVIGTAQNLDISEEAWDGAVELAESVPDIAAEIQAIDRTNGKKQLRFVHPYGRYKIAAASRRGGRGLSGDQVNLDELREHQDWLAWAAVTKTTMARPDPQVWAFSNAGDDRSVVLNDMQAKGRAAAGNPADADPSFGYFEWSAPDDCESWDRSAWPLANPSMGHGGVKVEALESALATDPPAVFRTECLCIRVPSLEPKPISAEDWAACSLSMPRPDGVPVFFVNVAPDSAAAAVGAAVLHEGVPRAEVAHTAPGTGWLVARCVELAQRYPDAAWWCDAQAAKAYLPDLEDAGLTVEVLPGTGLAAGCGHLQKLAKDRAFTYGPDPALEVAFAGAVKRDVGDGQWVWAQRRSAVDISPLVAVTGALWVLASQPVDDGPAFVFSEA